MALMDGFISCHVSFTLSVNYHEELFSLLECATCYPIGFAARLLFRLELHILIDSFELNVSPIAHCSTFFSIATTSHTDTVTQSYTDHTETQETQKSPTEHSQDCVDAIEPTGSIFHR